MIAMIRSGSSLAEACVALAHRGPDELQPGFLEFTSTYRATANFKSAVASVRDALQDPIADRVLVALLLANEVGGNDLVNLLSSICNAVREDLRVRDEVEARWSWNIAAARVAAGAPVVVLLLMSTQPQAASAYGSAGGITVIAMCALATAIGYLLMLRAARLPEERRLR
jgi:tight adherence protein B